MFSEPSTCRKNICLWGAKFVTITSQKRLEHTYVLMLQTSFLLQTCQCQSCFSRQHHCNTYICYMYYKAEIRTVFKLHLKLAETEVHLGLGKLFSIEFQILGSATEELGSQMLHIGSMVHVTSGCCEIWDVCVLCSSQSDTGVRLKTGEI